MNNEIFIPEEALDGLEAEFDSLKPITRPVIDFIRPYYKKIMATKKKGVSNAQIIEVLKGRKIKITGAKLDECLREIEGELMRKKATGGPKASQHSTESGDPA